MAPGCARQYSGGMTSHDSLADDVPVQTRRWCTVVMIPTAVLFCLVQASFVFGSSPSRPAGNPSVWAVVAMLAAFAAPFLLLMRDARPEATFWCCFATVVALPFSPVLMLMALTATIARRSDRRRTIRVCTAGTIACLWAELRDAWQPADASVWHMLFAERGTGYNGEPIIVLASETTIAVTAGVVAAIEAAVAILLGLHIRSRARLSEADARAQAAQDRADNLKSDLTNQQLADAIAAEAHDTLAHSLSLIALNASALKTEAARLPDSPEARSVADKAEDIRRQAAGALDEAHSIIDMLRNPAQAWKQLTPSTDTSLTRESLDALIADARNSGMQLNTWIDVKQLSGLDDGVAKVAYRAIQEALTNARRHAPGMPVSLEVGADPAAGVHLHVSNPMVPETALPPQEDESRSADSGAGLPGLAARVSSAGGMCQYGQDDRRTFHVDVTLPWR